MDDMLKPIANPVFMWIYGLSGDALIIIGIIAAVKNVTIAGFSPAIWFLLAIACYVIMVWIVALRILVNVENRTGS